MPEMFVLCSGAPFPFSRDIFRFVIRLVLISDLPPTLLFSSDATELIRVVQQSCRDFAREPERMQQMIVDQFHLTPADAAQYVLSLFRFWSND